MVAPSGVGSARPHRRGDEPVVVPPRTRRHVMSLVIVLLAAVALAAGATPALGQSGYPDRPIEMIVTFPPGGPTDTAARIIQPFMSTHLKVPVVLVNKGGSGGAVAMDAVAKAKPDGYTIAATVRSSTTISPAV